MKKFFKYLLYCLGSVKSNDFSDGEEEKELCYTVEEAIEHIGFGRFQMKVMLAVGLFQVEKVHCLSNL